jgi:hypothetical protein
MLLHLILGKRLLCVKSKYLYFLLLSLGVKGSWLGPSGVIVLPRGGPGGGPPILQGVIGADYSLSSPKTACAW